MTVAAVVLVPEAPAALVDADGEPALRRIGQTAWSGGALPTVAVTTQVTGELAELTDIFVNLPRSDQLSLLGHARHRRR